jgi:hypothetical protein
MDENVSSAHVAVLVRLHKCWRWRVANALTLDIAECSQRHRCYEEALSSKHIDKS